MTHSVSWFDRLRVERVVWTLDQRLYDLPRATRISIRREVRQNVLSAARDVGTRAALDQLGGTTALASSYLNAEFGDNPRHSWIAAALFFATYPLLLIAFLGEATHAFADGIIAANPNASGTFAWSGIAHLQTSVTFTFSSGSWTSSGGAMSPLAWVILVVGTVLAGRLWRIIPTRRRRRRAHSLT